MSENKKKSQAMPAKVVRYGAVAASIWKRQGPNGFEYFDFSLSRSWKSQTTEREGYSSNFFARNQVDLAKTVEEASEWIESQQADMQACLQQESEQEDGPDPIVAKAA